MINIRLAKRNDIKNVFELSNQDDVRKYSFQSSVIKWEEHEIWFKNILNDKNNILLIAEENNSFAGQIRFKLENSEATISISIEKSFQNKGIGKTIVNEAIEYLLKNHPNVKIIIALIKPENTKSIKFFEKLNFKFNTMILINSIKANKYIKIA
jgi:UDP-2,4-diacetamido-2,4,6-trideoxy-beta-L-altropyranose hydrolase